VSGVLCGFDRGVAPVGWTTDPAIQTPSLLRSWRASHRAAWSVPGQQGERQDAVTVTITDRARDGNPAYIATIRSIGYLLIA